MFRVDCDCMEMRAHLLSNFNNLKKRRIKNPVNHLRAIEMGNLLKEKNETQFWEILCKLEVTQGIISVYNVKGIPKAIAGLLFVIL